MKLLLDSCISNKTRDALQEAEHDVVWSGDWDEDPGDQEILATAYEQDRILVTLDKDFGELAVVRQLPHAGIVRLVNLSVKQQATVCLFVIEKYGTTLQQGAIVTAETNRVRIRPPET